MWLSFVALCSYRDWAIIVVGGFAIGEDEAAASVELYDIATNTWATDIVPDLNVAREGHSCCALGDNIYAFGGESRNDISAGADS